jgi:glycosyltransferase involved in cell wall biosynthesis
MSQNLNAAVSYVVTVYNKESFLPDVLAAIAAEHTATGGEILLVDDGSTDKSSLILSSFVKLNPAARIMVQPNRGVAAATNRGIAASSCPYVRLVDADDVIVAGSTIKLREVLEATECGFAFGRMAQDLASKNRDTHKYHILSDSLRIMLKTQPFIPSMTLGSAAAMKAVLPLPENIATSQDFSLGIKLARMTCFVEVDTLCCIVPQSSGGLSANKARMFRDTVLLCLKFAKELNWRQRYKRLALQRSAGRARNYFRRHAPGRLTKIVVFSLMAAVFKLPIPFPYERLMSYIATAYDSIVTPSESYERQ